MNVQTTIQKIWIQTVRDVQQKLSAQFSQLRLASVSLSCSGSQYSYSSCISDIGDVNDEQITTGLPALARDFNVILATDDRRSLETFLAKAVPLSGNPELGILVYDMLVYNRVAWLVGRSPTRDGRTHYVTQEYSDDRTLAKDSRELGALSIRSLRQILGLYGRLTKEFQGTDPVVAEALSKFMERVSTNVPSASELRNLPFAAIFMQLGQIFFRGYSLDGLATGDPAFRFAHGPGAVAERYTFDGKGWVFATDDASYDAISEVYFRTPFEENSWRGRYHSFAKLGAKSSRVVAVPKDYRGPRIIAAEPALHTYVQKGVDSHLRRFLGRSVLGRAIQLNDQSVNAALALEGSRKGAYATIDLSDASDTVRLEHLRLLLVFRKDLLEWFELLRTPSVTVGDKLVTLTTLFPMGSALCFPVESIIFTLVALSAVWQDLPFTGKSSPTRALMVRALDELELHVYGDDIVVRTKYARSIVAGLTAAGFLVNEAKCCLSGSFRESCGVDAYLGYDVTPLRPRLLPGASRMQLSSYCEQIQNFLGRGYFKTAIAILRHAQEALGVLIPIAVEGQPTEGLIVSRELFFLCQRKANVRFNKKTFSWNTYLPKAQALAVGDPNSYRRLMDALVKITTEEPQTETAGPVTETGRIKLRRTALYTQSVGLLSPSDCTALLS